MARSHIKGTVWKRKPAVTDEEWESQYAIFKQLYLEEGRTLEEVMQILKSRTGFSARYVSCDVLC